MTAVVQFAFLKTPEGGAAKTSFAAPPSPIGGYFSIFAVEKRVSERKWSTLVGLRKREKAKIIIFAV